MNKTIRSTANKTNSADVQALSVKKNNETPNVTISINNGGATVAINSGANSSNANGSANATITANATTGTVGVSGNASGAAGVTVPGVKEAAKAIEGVAN